MKWKNPSAYKSFGQKAVNHREEKQKNTRQIASRVSDGDVIGIGAGPTTSFFIEEISKQMIERNLDILAVPASRETELACCALSIPVTTLGCRRPDWAFAEADEIDADHNLIKGRNGEVFMEKMIIASAREVYILAEETGFVDKLGASFPLPLEVDPRAVNLVETELEKYRALDSSLRPAKGKYGPLYTEAGNLILDVFFEEVPVSLEKDLAAIPGVVETGLFVGYPVEVVTIR